MARNNECIEERNDSVRVHIPYYDELGIRRFYSKSFAIKKYGTKQRALEFAKKHRDEIKCKLANKQIVKTKKYTLDEVFNETIDIYNCVLSTKKKLICLYNKFIKSYIGGDRDFSTIKFDDIQKCLNRMVKDSKDDTIGRIMSIWRMLYKYAIAKDIVMKDETYNVSVPKSDIITIKKPMGTSLEEILDVIDSIENSNIGKRDKFLSECALLIMWYTGMRPSEVLALDINNIDLINNSIYVCQSVGSTSTEWNTIRKTKNETSIRYIPMVDELIPIINRLIESRNNDLLFIRNNGELMNGTILSEITRYVSNNKFRPYTIRHQFSTDMLTNNVDIRTIQELMGHKNSRMTIEYARSDTSKKIQALNNRQLN